MVLLVVDGAATRASAVSLVLIPLKDGMMVIWSDRKWYPASLLRFPLKLSVISSLAAPTFRDQLQRGLGSSVRRRISRA